MTMRLGDDPVTVRWFRADDAKHWPDWHHFASANWIGRQFQGGELGETSGSRPWRDGSNFKNIVPSEVEQCDPLWYQTGIPFGSTVELGSNDMPLCCQETCCELDNAQELVATVQLGSGCPCLDGLEVVLHPDDSIPGWRGNAIGCSDFNFAVTLFCTDLNPGGCIEFILRVTFSEHGPEQEAIPDAGCDCDPFHLEFLGITFDDPGSECTGSIDIHVDPA